MIKMFKPYNKSIIDIIGAIPFLGTLVGIIRICLSYILEEPEKTEYLDAGIINLFPFLNTFIYIFIIKSF